MIDQEILAKSRHYRQYKSEKYAPMFIDWYVYFKARGANSDYLAYQELMREKYVNGVPRSIEKARCKEKLIGARVEAMRVVDREQGE